MSLVQRAEARLRAFLNKRALDADLECELAAHLDMAIEENLDRGMTHAEARRQALVRMGGFETAKYEHREARGLMKLDIFVDDVKYTLRKLRRDRGFTAVAILILALGIGANVAVFSVVNTLLLRPLPFPNSQRLVRIMQRNPKGGESSMTYSTDAVDELRARDQSFEQITGYFAFSGPGNTKLIGTGQPQPLTSLMVAGNFFPTLGVEPMLGRQFSAEDCLKNSRPVTMMSYALWKRQFGANPGIVGQAIDLDGQQVTVIGVLPESFDFGSVFSPGAKVDFFGPAIFGNMEDWGNTMALVGRLKAGVTLAQAQAEADTVFPSLKFSLKHPEWGGNYTGNLVGLKDYVSGKLRRSLIVLWCAVGMILLIVCVNLSNLLLARNAARCKEFAMRTALGARRSRIVRQLLTESLILSSAGALLGLGMAYATIAWLAHQGSIALPLLGSLRIDGSALGWTMAIAIATSLLFGLAPSLRLAGMNLQSTLKESGPGSGDGRRHQRVRSVLVVGEVALAFMLLVGAGLLLRSFLHVLDVDLGFEPSRAAAISVSYEDGDNAMKRGVILQNVIQRVEQIPGVETAGVSDNLPMSLNRSWGISAKGQTYAKNELPATFVYFVTPGYLNAIGIHLLEGRDIAWDDNSPDLPVVIVNQTVARYLWPGQDPVGRIAQVSGVDARVIGVTADVRETNAETPAGWQMYLSMTAPQQYFGPVGANLVVRSKLAPAAVATEVMRVLRQINPGQPANEFKPIQLFVDHTTSPRRFFMFLVGGFASLGLILAALGIYGVISYSVTQRTQEIGIRMALGAGKGRVQRQVLVGTLWLTLTGILLGVAASLAAAKTIASLLFATSPWDVWTFAAIALMLVAVALVSGYVPARRASRISPMVAIRNN